MRCQLCFRPSWHLVCSRCLDTLLKPNLTRRTLDDGFEIYSFYKYSEIKPLLHVKHTFYTKEIFSLLSRHAILPFVKTLTCKDIFAIAVDDHIRSGTSHTAVIIHELREYMTPLYGVLRAVNRIRYSGAKLDIRKSFKRDFIYKGKKGITVVLFDDLITSGQTLLEAKNKLEECGVDVVFAVTLADARE